MTKEQLKTLNWVFESCVTYVNKRIQTLIEPVYGFKNIVEAEIKETGEIGDITGWYEYNGSRYDSWEEFSDAVKGVTYMPKARC